jgi:hypothetical protein
MGSLAIEAC